MGLFTKYCAICGKKIEKDNGIIRFGKHFDSEEHAEQYVKETEARRQAAREESEEESSCGGCG